MSLENIVKKAKKAIAIPLLAALGYVAPAKAGVITQYGADYTANPGTATLPIELINNDNGAVYNSYDLSLFYSFATSLFNLPQNQANYSSIEDMVSNWYLGIYPNPVGEVNMGWNASAGNYNPISINNIDGDINIDYDGWYATQQNDNQDTMAIQVQIPLTQLDGNGNGWDANDSSDYSIGMNSTPTADMGIGHSVDSFNYGAQGYEYTVTPNGVPEPTTGRVLEISCANGIPSIALTNSPSTLTVIVQRCAGDLSSNDWQTMTNLPPGTTNWKDDSATGKWTTLFYRLAK